jgi:DGQHR domain-containing protein
MQPNLCQLYANPQLTVNFTSFTLLRCHNHVAEARKPREGQVKKKFRCLTIQQEPLVLACVIPGRWLLERTTPSWRIAQPELGFQRKVSEERARLIAAAVLDEKRTFPNAIVLATDKIIRPSKTNYITPPVRIRFLIVDGQHRLWAQKFSEFEGSYCCVIHMGLDERQMAKTFVEINDNQKRVPSSLRWDLFRLVRDEGDPEGVRAADLIHDLAVEKGALFQKIDLTGEERQIALKQGSLAPQIKSLLTARRTNFWELGYENQLRLLRHFLTAVREIDPSAWDKSESPLYQARVLRALLRIFGDLLQNAGDVDEVRKLSAKAFLPFLSKIKLSALDPEKLRATQGSSGIKAIYETLRQQIF